MLTVTTELALAAFGVSLLMIGGEFDLSVGSVFCASAMLFGFLSSGGVFEGVAGGGWTGGLGAGLSEDLALLVTLLLAAFIGFCNGIVTLKAKIPSFLVTLGTMMFIRGLVLLSTGGWSVTITRPTILLDVLAGPIGTTPFRTSVFWLVGAMVIFSVILASSRFGNHIVATGGNRDAADAMGVRTFRTKLLLFTICGLMAGFSGVVAMSRFHLADATMGEGMELETITGAVIGGNVLTGGFGTIVGTIIGCLLVGLARSGLILIGVPGYVYEGILGVVLVITVIINRVIRTRAMAS